MTSNNCLSLTYLASLAESKGQVGTGPCHAFYSSLKHGPTSGGVPVHVKPLTLEQTLRMRVDHSRTIGDMHRYAPVGCAVMRFRNMAFAAD